MQKRLVSLTLLGFTATILFAQDPADIAATSQQKSTATAAAAGKAEFGQTCGFCHGANGRGASGPDLIHSSLVSHDVNGDLIGQVVRNGRPEKGMPAFQLSDGHIRSIAVYLHAEAKLASTTYQRGPGEYAVEKLLVGNAQAGRTYFEGAGKCAACHSPGGDLAHVAAKYKPIDLQSRIAFPAGAVPTITVTERSGEVTSGSQVYADEFVVSLRDKNNWIHSWNRALVTVGIKNPLAAHEEILSQMTDAHLHDLFAYLETLK